jgi:hypothetical protein
MREDRILGKGNSQNIKREKFLKIIKKDCPEKMLEET